MTDRRYTPQLKAAIIESIRRGQITRQSALTAHNLTEEELQSWEALYDHHGGGSDGTRALRATYRQHFVSRYRQN